MRMRASVFAPGESGEDSRDVAGLLIGRGGVGESAEN